MPRTQISGDPPPPLSLLRSLIVSPHDDGHRRLYPSPHIVTTPRQLIEDLYGKNFYKSTSGKKDKNEEKNQKENKVILGNDNTVVTDFSKISRLLEQELLKK